MTQQLITNTNSKKDLIDLQNAYRSLSFFKRVIFRLATLPFMLWSWPFTKNPATIDPEKTTQQDLLGLVYFFKHCWPAFFRTVFGIMDAFIKSELYRSVTKSKPIQKIEPRPAELPIPPAPTPEPVQLSTSRIQQSLGPSLSFSLDNFLKSSPFPAVINQQIQHNLQKLDKAYHTKDASDAYKLIGALLMINDQACITKADELMHNTPITNDTDKHIMSARYKANVVIEHIAGPSSVPHIARQVSKIWQPFNDSLQQSLTQDERDNISDSTVYSRIIESVLLPDTLMMGLHPLQESVLKYRQALAFNPRIQFIDESWEGDLQHYKGDLPQDILDDFNRRTLSLSYGDQGYFLFNPHEFIQANDKHYQRVIFDGSSLCGVGPNGLLYLQKVLKNNRMIYVQEESSLFNLTCELKTPRLLKFIPGKMEGHPCTIEGLDIADHWFVTNANHPCNKEFYFYAYQRTDLPLEKGPVKIVTPELIEKARSKLMDPEYNGNLDRIRAALIDVNTDGTQASEAIRLAQINPTPRGSFLSMV